jgi:CRISPR-associated protein (TIGR02710 family)
MMAEKGMLITVGHGGKFSESLMNALAKSVNDVDPKVVVFIHSRVTKENAQELDNRLREGRLTEFLCLEDENHVDRIFSEILAEIESICNRGLCLRENLQIDFTSGTKAMSAGAVLAAVTAGLHSLRYIGGQRENGHVIEGMEEFIDLPPHRYLANTYYHECKADLKKLRYNSALDTLKLLSHDAALPQQYRGAPEVLRILCQAYKDWDIFLHADAYTQLKDVKSHPDLADLNFNKDNLYNLKKIGDLLSEDSDNHAPQPKADHKLWHAVMADLYNNAVRRYVEDKYDDCCARLYRLVEMGGQTALRKRGINSSRVYENQVPPAFKDKYPSDFAKKDEKGRYAQIGLQKDFELLEMLGDEVGIAFKKDNELKNQLQNRNSSILAHGTSPVEKVTCDLMMKRIQALMNIIAKDFDTLCQTLQFPWIKNP